MNCLLMYSHQSGHKSFVTQIPYVKERLLARFDRVDFVSTSSKEEATQVILDRAPKCDVLVIVGGDGTFNNAINSLKDVQPKPILGYINYGTIGDIGRNFGIGSGLKRSIDILVNGGITSFDVGEINGELFAYVCTIGRYSDIAYLTSRKKKRVLGKVAYYNAAIKELGDKKMVHASIDADGGHYEIDTPFLLVLNGINIGGFKVNRFASIQDGKMELFMAKCDLSNGVLPLLANKDRVVLRAREFLIKTDEQMGWCLDGEEGPKGEAHIITHPGMFKIIAKKNFVK